MGKPPTSKQILIWVLIAIALSFLIAHVDRPKSPPPVKTAIPPPPDSSEGWYYSLSKEEWRKIFRGNPRANGVNSSSEAQKPEEVDIQDYLEKHVDGYLEDTYWGEEYDVTDKED